MDNEADDFFGNANPTPKALRPLGLVVPAPARIFYDAKGAVIWDELVEIEREYRMNGKPAVVFDDSEVPQ